MTTYTNLSDTSLSQDKPLTQSIARAFRDNPLAIAEGDNTAPEVEVKAINCGGFRATWTGNVSVSNGSVIPFPTEVFDENGWYDNSTYRYTPQKEGLYVVSAYVIAGTGSTATSMSYQIRKNGGLGIGPAVSYGIGSSAQCTGLVYMNGTTDYLDVLVNFAGGTLTVGGGSTSTFSGALVAAP